jgi:hypothetical protein
MDAEQSTSINTKAILANGPINQTINNMPRAMMQKSQFIDENLI